MPVKIKMTQSTQLINSWLYQLGEFILDEQGRCFLTADNGIELAIYTLPESDQFYIDCELITVFDDHSAALFEHALILNMHQQITQGASIALDAENKVLLLCYTRHYEYCSFQQFANILNNVALLASELSAELMSSLQREERQAHARCDVSSMLRI